MPPKLRPWIPLIIVLLAMAGGLAVVNMGPGLQTEADWSRNYRCTSRDHEPRPARELRCETVRPPRAESAHAEKVLEKRLELYEADLGQLRTTLWLQLVVLVFAFIVLWTKPPEFEVPVIGLKVPAKWIHVVIPLALVYLLVSLGYLFDHLIQERYFLWQQTLSLEGGRGLSIHSYGPLIDDRWVMDIWFSEFHPHFMSNPGGAGTSVAIIRDILLFGFGAFVAAQQICILALLERSKFPSPRRWTAIWLVCFVGAVFVLVLNQVAFWSIGGNPNWVQWCAIGPLTLVGYGAWIVVSNGQATRQPQAAAVAPVRISAGKT